MENRSFNPSPEWRQIFESLEKPLLYASHNEFANVKKLKGLEPYVETWLDKAGRLGPPPFPPDLLQRFGTVLRGFDAMDPEGKKNRVREAQGLLDKMKAGEPPGEGTPSLPTFPEFQKMRQELQTPIQYLKGVGPRLSEILKKKNIRTVEDALYFLPRAYEDRRFIKKISQLTVGKQETAVGEVLSSDVVHHGRRRSFTVMIGDETGILTAKWFNFNPRFMKDRFRKGMRVILSGEIRMFQFQKEIHHPELEVLEDPGEKEKEPSPDSATGEESLHFQRIVPIYSETEGLYQRQRLIRRIQKRVVDQFAAKAVSGLPAEICRRQGLIPLSEALRRAHFPDLQEDIQALQERKSPAHRRLIFEEFFFMEIGLALRRSGTALEKGIAFPISHRYTQKLRSLLPFALTPAQDRVIREIEGDMRKPHPMNRLLQGDVGSGKTLVALTAALMAIEGGYQVAIMAPTEILAEQHFLNIRPLIEQLGLRSCLLTSSSKKKQRDVLLQDLQDGAVQIAIGTHALIQGGVEFRNLGLAIIDEQHKFGVLQRANLKKKGYHPDVLVMTATPIPRTLAMTLYGDLDVSVIDQLPPGRGVITTRVFSEKERHQVYRLLREELGKGKQAYVVYPLVEESERLDLKDATQMAAHLQRDIFPEFKVGLLHGRMKSEEKEAVMADFKGRRLQVLVSTIVIEVGIDVPNASVMVIEHAERFGLSQLHQLRGRVGRSQDPAQCLLIAQYRRSEDAEQRLRIMEKTRDGFKIAEEDLAIRGPGELLGTQQSGLPEFRVADFVRDFPLLAEARKEAFALIDRDPPLSKPEHYLMKETLTERWKGKLELARVG
jgi:ATP-dependent DNA helicase RecG